MMSISSNGVKLIQQLEGLRLSAYQDVAGVWTIGYGSTYLANGNKVTRYDKLHDVASAVDLLKYTLIVYENAVNNYVKVSLSQNQFDALCSFTYNLGIFALKNSTLLKSLNNNHYDDAADAFLLWNKITDPRTGLKKVCDTLTQRRFKERELFLTPTTTTTTTTTTTI